MPSSVVDITQVDVEVQSGSDNQCSYNPVTSPVTLGLIVAAQAHAQPNHVTLPRVAPNSDPCKTYLPTFAAINHLIPPSDHLPPHHTTTPPWPQRRKRSTTSSSHAATARSRKFPHLPRRTAGQRSFRRGMSGGIPRCICVAVMVMSVSPGPRVHGSTRVHTGPQSGSILLLTFDSIAPVAVSSLASCTTPC
jgi:hypothetical protein